jgi:hypothetical protein
MTTRNALRHAIASGHAREVKALLDKHDGVRALKKYLEISDDQLVEHLKRLADELGAEGPEKSQVT